MNTEFINGVTQDDINNLTSQVNQASNELQKIKDNNELIKANKREFYEHIENALVEKFKDIDIERELKVLKGLFNKVVNCELNKDETVDGTLRAGYLRKRVEEMVMLIYALRYLKYDNVSKMFESYGIKLEFKPVEDIVPYFSGTNFKDTMREFVNQAVELQTKSNDLSQNISENLYNAIPATIRYNKQANPTGINKSTFKKFSILKLLKKINVFKARKKYETMAVEAENKSKADTLAVSIADTLVSEGTQE